MKYDVKAFRKKLGISIAKQRELAGLTQEQVAEKLGIGNEAVSRIERGVVEPSAVRMMQLADVFDCSVMVFFEESSERLIDSLLLLNNEMIDLSVEQKHFVTQQAIGLSKFLKECG